MGVVSPFHVEKLQSKKGPVHVSDGLGEVIFWKKVKDEK